jgi:hypothetical protein
MIKYKEIDQWTDMVVATSGSTFINYNRIISSSASPYFVKNSQTFRDPVSSTSRKLYAIYIIDLNNVVSLIYGNADGSTDLAKINFLTQSIKYQKAFPKITNLKSAIFISPTVYYAGS